MSATPPEIVEQAFAVYAENEAKWCAEMEQMIREELEVTIREEIEQKVRAEFKQKIREEFQGFDWPEGDSGELGSPILKRSKATPAHENVMLAPLSPINAPLVPPPICVMGPCDPGTGCHICYDHWCLSATCTICDPFHR
jgi:hypothetical protein